MQVSDLCHLSPLGKSDHDIIIFNFHADRDFAKTKYRYTYTNGEYDVTRNELHSTNRSKGFVESGSEKSVEELWGLLKSKLTELRNRFVPKMSISGRPSWENKGSFHLGKDRREAIQNKIENIVYGWHPKIEEIEIWHMRCTPKCETK